MMNESFIYYQKIFNKYISVHFLHYLLEKTKKLTKLDIFWNEKLIFVSTSNLT